MALYRTKKSQVRYEKVGIQKTPVTSNPRPEAERNWRAVKLMISALLSGLVVAVAQHLTNTYLNGRELGSVRVSQGWITRIETALAFLVKTCLVIATGEAFIQHQWLHLRHQPLMVKDIDTMTGILGNILNFANISVWFRRPLLTLIAVITWTIPLAAIVTPGSLSVEQKSKSNITYLQVPQPDWVEGSYGYVACCGDSGEVYANQTTYRIAYATGVNANLLSLPSRFQNQSYHLEFYGPAIKCGMAQQNVTDILGGMFNNHPGGTIFNFVSWVPSYNNGHGLPYEDNQSSAQVSLQTLYASIDQRSIDGSRIFVMTNKNYTAKNVTVSECLLYNATYNVNFNFSYPNQDHQIAVSQYFDPIAGRVLYGYSQPAPSAEGYKAIASYASVMDAFGRLLVGASYSNQYGSKPSYFTSYTLLSINWTDPGSMQRGLEALFQNITLSLLSDASLTKNSSRAALVPVTVTSWPVTYVYSPWELWIAYGLSCGFALACILVGTYAFVSNEGSYQNIFSTFARALSDKDEFHYQVRIADNATDPLPQQLAGVRLQMRKGK